MDGTKKTDAREPRSYMPSHRTAIAQRSNLSPVLNAYRHSALSKPPCRFVAQRLPLNIVGAVRRPVARRAFALPFATVVAACETQPTHEVLALTELAPRQVEAGDHVTVHGSGFPQTADIRRVTVTLTGTLARPGLAPCPRPVAVTLTDPPNEALETNSASAVVGAAIHGNDTFHTLRVYGGTDIEFTLTDALVRQLTTCPGERTDARVPHATLAFVGPHAGISVEIETIQGTTLTAARPLRGPHLDVLTPWGRDVSEGRAARAEAMRTLATLGIQLLEEQPPEGGLQIAHVTPGSPAAEAALEAGDVLERLDGVTLLSVTDFRPALGNDLSVVSIRRGDAVEDRTLRVATLTRTASWDIVATAVLLLVALVVVAMSASPTHGLLGWLAIRFLPPPAPSPPATSWHAVLERAWINLRNLSPPHLSFGSVVVATTALAIPLAEFLFDADVDLGVVHLLGTLTALLLAAANGRDSAGRSSLVARLGGVGRRALFELAAVGAVVAAILSSGSSDLRGILAAQGGAPWDWSLFHGPARLTLGLVHLAALAPIAADVRMATNRLLRWMAWSTLFTRAACAVLLLGGALRLPGVSLEAQEASVALQMLGAVVFSLKTWSLVALARHVAPAVSSAHPTLLSTLASRHLFPLAVIGAVFTALGDTLYRELPVTMQEIITTIASRTMVAIAMAVVAVLAMQRTMAHCGFTGTAAKTP
jgi:NADH-quinone oxidoreductase subunit H